jgi:methyl-accepting chemotaxis protein
VEGKAQGLLEASGSLTKAMEVQSDSKCPLGQWIYGKGKTWNASPNYEVLRKEHARFHRAAAEIIRKADSGQSTGEEVAIGLQSEFTVASAAVVNAITRIRSQAH